MTIEKCLEKANQGENVLEIVNKEHFNFFVSAVENTFVVLQNIFKELEEEEYEEYREILYVFSIIVVYDYFSTHKINIIEKIEATKDKITLQFNANKIFEKFANFLLVRDELLDELFEYVKTQYGEKFEKILRSVDFFFNDFDFTDERWTDELQTTKTIN